MRDLSEQGLDLIDTCRDEWNKAGGKVLAGLVARRAAEAQLFELA
jgi:GH24 family phage-related lysozyme (muramidase)